MKDGSGSMVRGWLKDGFMTTSEYKKIDKK